MLAVLHSYACRAQLRSVVAHRTILHSFAVCTFYYADTGQVHASCKCPPAAMSMSNQQRTYLTLLRSYQKLLSNLHNHKNGNKILWTRNWSSSQLIWIWDRLKVTFCICLWKCTKFLYCCKNHAGIIPLLHIKLILAIKEVYCVQSNYLNFPSWCWNSTSFDFEPNILHFVGFVFWTCPAQTCKLRMKVFIHR